jgi:hypothetical protein
MSAETIGTGRSESAEENKGPSANRRPSVFRDREKSQNFLASGLRASQTNVLISIDRLKKRIEPRNEVYDVRNTRVDSAGLRQDRTSTGLPELREIDAPGAHDPRNGRSSANLWLRGMRSLVDTSCRRPIRSE